MKRRKRNPSTVLTLALAAGAGYVGYQFLKGRQVVRPGGIVTPWPWARPSVPMGCDVVRDVNGRMIYVDRFGRAC